MFVVSGDFSNQFFPFRFFAGQEWWSRRVPLWNPYVYGGHPFLADVQTAVFYPLAMLNAIAWGRSGLPYVALEAEIVVHTFLAAVFMYLLARKITGSIVGSLVAGLAFGLGGFVTSYPAQQLAILETIAWLPLIVLLLELALDLPVSWPWLLAASTVFGVAILAGHPQTDLFIAYTVEGYLLFRLWRARAPLARALAALFAFPAGALGVAAIQILPTIEFFTQSMRIQMDFAEAAHGYLLSALCQIFVPLWHGEKALSIGIVALVLAVAGAIVSRRESLAYWTVAGLIAVPISTGGATPLFWLLYVAAPGWNLFRDQERVICIFSFAAALLAARGVAVLESAAAGLRLTRATIGIAAAGALLSLGLIGVGSLVDLSSGLRSSLAIDAVALAVLALVLVMLLRAGKLSPPLATALVVLVAAESLSINQGNNLGPTSPNPRPRLAATAQFMRAFPEPFRVKGLSESLFPSNYGTILGTPMITGDTPFTTQRADELLTSNPDYKVWQLLNLKFFVTDAGPLGGLKPVFHDGPLTTYYLEDSLPRAWAVTAYEVARDAAEARAMILAPSYHPGNIVVLEQPPAIGPLPTGPRPDVKITHLDPQRIAIDATADQNGILVLADAYYPGWNAYRDGTLVPTYRANYLTMAFDLPAGQHHFEIVYQPVPFYIGAVVTLAMLTVVFVVARSAMRRRRIAISLPTSLTRLEPALIWLTTAAVLTGAFALRLHALADPNLTGDEWFMLRNHDEGVAWIVHQANTFEPHPLIYYVGLAGWIELAGRSEFAMRFPSVSFGVMLVAALIALGRTLIGTRAGLIAGALAAINPYQVAESQNARNYEMVAAASAVASVLFLRALAHNRRRDWIAYGVGMLVALNVHYDAALVLACHVAYVAVTRALPAVVGRRRNSVLETGPVFSLRSWSIVTGVVTTLFVAWLAYAAPALAAYHGYFPTPVGIDRVLARSLATFSLGTLASVRDAIPAFALAVLAAGWLSWQRRAVGLFLGLYVLLPILAVSLLFLVRPMYDERYLIVLAPGFLVFLAVGIEGLLRLIWPIGALTGVAAVAITAPVLLHTYSVALTDRPDYRSMARWVAAYGSAGDPIVSTGHGQAELFTYYYRGTETVRIIDDPTQLNSVETLMGSHAGLWLLPFWHSDADNAALATLGAGAVPVAERWFVNGQALYFGSTARLKPSPVAPASWGDALRLDSVSLTSSPVRPGEAVDAELRLDDGAAISSPKLSLRLFDPDGDLVGQTDRPLGSAEILQPGSQVSRLGVLVPPASPPGRYSVAVLPYNGADGKPLSLTTIGQEKDGALVLGAVDVGVRDGSVAADEAGVSLIPPHAFESGLSLLGRDQLPGDPSPGDVISFRLLWRADRRLPADSIRTLDLRNGAGQVVATSSEPILASFPTSKWAAGELLAERAHFKVPATLNTGSYTVTLRFDSDNRPVTLGSLSVKGPDRLLSEPSVGQPIGVQFGAFATLARAAIAAPSAGPGSAARVTVVWRARATADRPYTVFVHLVDSSGNIVAQVDRPPAGGGRQTDGWVNGEFIVDDFNLLIPGDAGAGPYVVEVGFYDPTTGARVPASLPGGGRSDHVVVASIGNAG
jgi:hypothetical protein